MQVKAAILAAGLLLVSQVANAEIVVYKFTGKAVQGSVLVPPGTLIEGIFSYDTATPPENEGGFYASYRPSGAFTISGDVGGHRVVAATYAIDIQNDAGGNTEDSFVVDGGPVMVNGEYLADGAFGLVLSSGPGNTGALVGTALPEVLDLSRFVSLPDARPNTGYLMADRTGNGGLVDFDVVSLERIDSAQGCARPPRRPTPGCPTPHPHR